MDMLYKLSSPSRHALGGTILDLDLTSLELVSHDGQRSRSPFDAGAQMSIPRVVSALRAARDDPRVAGFVVRGVQGLSGAGLADLEEVRRAVEDFGSGGKKSLLYVAEGLGLAGNGTVPLYFGSAFSSVHVMPTSPVLVPGLSLGSMFFKGTLDKLGVEPIKVARKEYKTAANSFTEDGFTEPHRESTQALMDSILTVLTDGIAGGRGMKKDDVRAAFDDAIMTAESAVERGLIDVCAYRDELPGIMRRHLASGVQRRYEERVKTEKEWREAMAGLVEAWKDGVAWKDELHQADSLLKATHYAAQFVRKDLETDGENRVAHAELRAMKAHLAWLETNPWEGLPRGEVIGGFTAGSAFSLIELEKRLCVEAIRAHENFTTDLVTKTVKSGTELSGSFPALKLSVRWVRSLWRGKALCARMVGSMLDAPNLVEASGSTTKASDLAAKALNSQPQDPISSPETSGPAPRFFLLHAAGSPALPNVPPTSGAADYVELSKNRATHVDRLRYVSFADYQNLVSSENRAGSTARNSWAGVIDSEPEMTSVPTNRGLVEFNAGLVDGAERSQLLHLADHNQLLGSWRLASRGGPTVAVIHVDGAIMDSGAEELRGAIRRASKDRRIDAIVVRVDSPGGSATASDLISRAVEVTKKPIVCSMGNVCASGGLFIAVPADKVFCEEATITGSCGVIFSGFLPIDLFKTLGITVDSVESNKLSKYFGSAGAVTPWNEEYTGKINALIDDMYKSFVSAVARGRGMAYDDVESIARGRVWSGIDAKRVGLVDEFGGLTQAAACAAELSGGEPGAIVSMVSYPTIGMKLEDTLKANGVIRSRLDEEGDEESPRERRGKKQSRLSRLLSGDDNENGDDEADAEEDSERDLLKDDVGSGDPTSRTDLSISEHDMPEGKKAPSSSLLSRGGFLGAQGVLISAAESWLDFRDDCISSSALWCLARLENNLMSENPSPTAAKVVEFLLGSVLSHSGVSAAVVSELQAAVATSGRPAMIMSPQVHTDIGTGRSNRSGRS